MPFPDHYRAVIDGVFVNNAGTILERWSTSYRVGASNGFSSAALNESDYIDNELTDFTNRLINLSGLYASTTRVTKLSFNRINALGRYANGSQSFFKDLSGATQINGSVAASTIYPLQCSVVATLRSDRLRGPASHGRMFLPMPQVNLTDNRVIHPTDVGTVLAAVVDAFEHADGTQTGLIGSRYFPALVTPKGAGDLREVLSVEVGSVVDTMRSRRASLVETRQSAVLT